MTPEQFISALNGWADHFKASRDDVPSYIVIRTTWGSIVEGAWAWADDSDDVLIVNRPSVIPTLIAVQSIGTLSFFADGPTLRGPRIGGHIREL